MICPKCGSEIPKNRNYCDTCGANLTIYKRIMHLSNFYYNKGLEKAGIRDLSGAVFMLKKSLGMNKRNTEARNLLGLVYFEMGETVAALGEWVISKHFQPEENRADEYMDRIQSAPTKLDAMNQAIKKYNIALEAARQGGDDLAILQLKKVVSLNPKFIRARLLLALLYIHRGQPERAKKQLLHTLQIDMANTAALRYLQEITLPQQETEQRADGDAGEPDGGYIGGGYTSKGGLKEELLEEKPNVTAWVTLVVGTLIGVLVTFILIVPTARRNIRAEYDKEQLDYSSELRVKEATIASLEKEAELWQGKYEDTAKELSSIVIPEYDTAMYDGLFDILAEYLVLEHQEEPSFEQLFALAGQIAESDAERFENSEAKRIYEKLRDEVYGRVAEDAYHRGREVYDEGDYAQSGMYLKAACEYGYVRDSCYYYLGRSLQYTQEYEQAAVYYRMLLEEFPDSSLASYARTRLSEMGME